VAYAFKYDEQNTDKPMICGMHIYQFYIEVIFSLFIRFPGAALYI